MNEENDLTCFFSRGFVLESDADIMRANRAISELIPSIASDPRWNGTGVSERGLRNALERASDRALEDRDRVVAYVSDAMSSVADAYEWYARERARVETSGVDCDYALSDFSRSYDYLRSCRGDYLSEMSGYPLGKYPTSVLGVIDAAVEDMSRGCRERLDLEILSESRKWLSSHPTACVLEFFGGGDGNESAMGYSIGMISDAILNSGAVGFVGEWS